ncbi:MAG: dihydrofolate reductase [Gammaproteobacteria bacterium]|nr:dihydrofolate reductase [Gammaproteobacteria bacterium]
MRLSLIAAVDRNGLIGAGRHLPWRLPADLRRFRQITMGHPIVMGRATWDSLGRPLPGRENVVVSTRLALDTPGATVVRSVDAAILAASRANEAMVIGGATLYAQTLPRAERIYLTRVESEFEGDVFFPRFDETDWVEVAREPHPADDENPWFYAFTILERKDPGGA